MDARISPTERRGDGRMVYAESGCIRAACRRFRGDTRGSSGIAYALILAAIAIMALVAVGQLELSVSGTFKSAGRLLGNDKTPAGSTRTASGFKDGRDVLPPRIQQLTPPITGGYRPGQALVFILTASEPVKVEGTPSLPLTLGDRDVAAPFYALRRGNQLIFRYVVQPEDRGAGRVHLTTLSINQNGGVIQDLAGNRLLSGLPSSSHLDGIYVIDNCAGRRNCP